MYLWIDANILMTAIIAAGVVFGLSKLERKSVPIPPNPPIYPE